MMDDSGMKIVVAGILKHGDTVLVCRRRANQPHPLKWEFPGGKAEPGESPVAALQRELREELGIDSDPGTEITRYEFVYPGQEKSGREKILLIFLLVAVWRGAIENRIFDQIVWAQPDRLREFDFLEGDFPFICLHFGDAVG